MLLRSRTRTETVTTLRSSAPLIDSDTGIIGIVYENPGEPDGPAVHGFGSLLADTSRYGVDDFGLVNGSTSLRREQAAAGAIGEAVERYACRIVPWGDFTVARYADLAARGVEVVDPRTLLLYSEEQYERPGFPYRRFDEDDPLAWTPGYSITHDRAVLVPAVAVFMATVDPGRRPLVQQTTNGLACGASPEEAILSGLYEVVERDALMLTWMARASRPKILLEGDCTSQLRECVRAFATAGAPVDAVDITTDLAVPTVLATSRLRGPGGGGPVFSSAAGPDLEAAAAGALEELVQSLLWVSAMSRRGLTMTPLDELTTTDDHVLWALRPEYRARVDFLTAGASTRACAGPSLHNPDVLEELRAVVALLARRGLDVVVVDVTPPDVAEVGLHVVRTLVPGALPLHFGSGLHRTGPRATDRLSSCAGGGTLNLAPHPFP